MNLDQIYQMAPDLKSKAATLKMKDGEWRFLFAFDGRKTVREIMVEKKLDEQSVTQLLHKLRQNVLLVDAEISLEDFLSRNVHSTVSLPDANEPPKAATPAGPAAAASIVTEPVAPSVPITFTITRNTGTKSTETVSVSAVSESATSYPVSAPVPVSVTESDMVMDSTATSGNESPIGFSLKRNPFKLKPVIDFIVQQAGGGTVGQLAVYRVFLKIPPQLLQEANVESLNLVTGDMEIDHPPFRDAVLNSVAETLGVSFPSA